MSCKDKKKRLFFTFNLLSVPCHTKSAIMTKFILFLIFAFSATLWENIAIAQSNNQITLEQIFQDYRFYPLSPDKIKSMADGEHYSVLENGTSILKVDYKTGLKKEIVFSTKQLTANIISFIHDYEFNSDETKILLTTQKTFIYRHSYSAFYYIYDLLTNEIIPLDKSGKQQLAVFSPDGQYIAYVRDNNLYYKDLKDNTIVQVTFDGKVNNIINGATDWVYEEEFSLESGFCWSHDSRRIAFYRFDETRVKQFEIMQYHELYPQAYSYKYPKAGDENSVISIHVYDKLKKNTIRMNTGKETDQYIPRIKWAAKPDLLCIIRLNRAQNKVDVMLANAASGESAIIYSEKNKSYVPEINDNFIYFTEDQQSFLILSERSGYFHYYLYSIQGELMNPITQGNWDVDALIGIDFQSRLLYFTSTEESPLQRSIYSVRLDGTHKSRLSDLSGTNTAEFSKTFQYFINTWSNANTPARIMVYEKNGRFIRTIEDNNALLHEMKIHGFTRKEFIKIPGQNDIAYNAYILKPFDFDSTRKYPLLISVYGGPESQEVTDSWDNDLPWYEMLAQHGIIVACIDNRGTGGRGEAFRKSIYLQLGKLETEDQIYAAIYLGSKNWIDENRIGIWGWSYGGYLSLLCLTRAAEIFKMGVAVAPITSWRFYDTIYTERYLRKPNENPEGYDENSPITYAGKLKGKLLLIHGTADDNVHLQHTLELTDRLVKENKQFEMFLYPGKNHNISGGNTRYHLFKMITDFILKNL
jgi:dipeptidyl-peptidase-4